MSLRERVSFLPSSAFNKTVLATLTAITLTACGGDSKDNTSKTRNTAPSINVDPHFTVDEGASVLLNSVITDEDSIKSIQWSQESGPTVKISNANTENMSFIAPEVTKDIELAFTVTAEDNKGSVSHKNVSVTVNDVVPFLISDIQPVFGIAGTEITIKTNLPPTTDDKISLSGKLITPSVHTSNSITFTVPEDAVSGSLFVKGSGGNSNSIWFSVSETGIKAPDETKLLTDDSGSKYVSDYLIVSVLEDDNTLDNATRLSNLVSGTIIGQNKDLAWWQISVSAKDMTELESLASTLKDDSTVDNVVIDTISEQENIDWSQDPDFGSQRDRNNVEKGAALYATQVSLKEEGKAIPFQMAIGVSEEGIDFNLLDFSGHKNSAKNVDTNINIYSKNKDSSLDGEHGSNVVGVIAGQLGDGGTAGLLASVGKNHSGANIRVDQGTGTIAGIFNSTLDMIKSGAQVVNWSWGTHRRIDSDINKDGIISQDEIVDGAVQCDGFYTNNNTINQSKFDAFKKELNKFFTYIEKNYPSVVIVASAGNGATDAGSIDNRIPSSKISNQLIVVGAHTSGGTFPDKISEDNKAASDYPTSCFDTSIITDVKRSFYSNYGERVDISASGTIVGFKNDYTMGTSYATPIVTATVALMQSINPNLSPAEIKDILRSSALPIENKVVTKSSETVFTRSLTKDESETHSGKGARLNVEGAIQAALDSLENTTLVKAPSVAVKIPEDKTEVTKTIEVTIPGDKAVFDKVDVMFVVDVSGSYYDDLDTFKDQATELIEAFSSSGTNVNIGISSFSDFPLSPYGSSDDYAFKLDQPLTNNYDLVKSALDNLLILSGNDYPESQLEAIYQTVQPATGWRSGSLPTLFLATDARFHNSDMDDGYPGSGYDKTISELKTLKARVFGLQSGGVIDDVKKIAEQSGGAAFKLSKDSAEIVENVTAALDSASSNFAITLVPHGDFNKVVSKIVPSSSYSVEGNAITNVNAGDTVSFDVTFSKSSLSDIKEHTIAFRLLVNADDVAVIQEIPVVLEIN